MSCRTAETFECEHCVIQISQECGSVFVSIRGTGGFIHTCNNKKNSKFVFLPVQETGCFILKASRVVYIYLSILLGKVCDLDSPAIIDPW